MRRGHGTTSRAFAALGSRLARCQCSENYAPEAGDLGRRFAADPPRGITDKTDRTSFVGFVGWSLGRASTNSTRAI
jgi:hypothetical protein